ncbi:conserved hypothetical protein, partial [Ricinus communis]
LPAGPAQFHRRLRGDGLPGHGGRGHAGGLRLLALRRTRGRLELGRRKPGDDRVVEHPVAGFRRRLSARDLRGKKAQGLGRQPAHGLMHRRERGPDRHRRRGV